ncbi:MAG: response regulator [Rhodospirillaceae bacterium]
MKDESGFHLSVVGMPSLRALAPQGRIRFDSQFRATTWEETTNDAGDDAAEHRVHILVAEDDPTTRMILRNMLEKAEFAVTTANDGTEAVAALRNGAFDLVLLDIQMPGMNGIDVARHVRRAAGGAKIPVIAVTSETEDDQVDAMLAVGFDGIMGKPVRRDDLIRVILAALAHAAA